MKTISFLLIILYLLFSLVCQRRVREVWDSKKELLRETGKQVVQQLAEATAAVAPSQELAESSVPAQAVSLCAMQVCSILPHVGLHVLRVPKRVLFFIPNHPCIWFPRGAIEEGVYQC